MAKIILAEDDSMTVEIYQKKFRDAGFDVVVALTGAEILERVKKEGTDLVLLDLVLPEIGGLEVLKELKKSGKYDTKLKVVVFSNLDSKEDQAKALKYGADRFISKTKYAPSELVEEVKKIMGEDVKISV